MTKRPTGELCPICRTPLFSPSLFELIKRYYGDVLTFVTLYLGLVVLGAMCKYHPPVFILGFVLFSNPFSRILDNVVVDVKLSLVAFGLQSMLMLVYRMTVNQISGLEA
ncbi:uncharacterized protein EKO05_0003599 [Ascochyta rabiei]|uniref:Uncharacterized protein n=1 Tax=Didymella rabiei TaxID=5454 RepID=A0A163LVL4_DIDRA|nr:uncharacterized protein EKO05_0003599 [Ascochyta rabiei]KZM28162.1 hypothetical protein ST47_g689 [Ascochyta rabiei]UPX13071.1 hypothetical protein EKO05_0003599 [Ascochyta rabiei]